MSKTFYKWLGTGYLPEVPQRDLTESEWEALTDFQRAALAPWYKKTQPRRKDTSSATDKPDAQESK